MIALMILAPMRTDQSRMAQVILRQWSAATSLPQLAEQAQGAPILGSCRRKRTRP